MVSDGPVREQIPLQGLERYRQTICPLRRQTNRNHLNWLPKRDQRSWFALFKIFSQTITRKETKTDQSHSGPLLMTAKKLCCPTIAPLLCNYCRSKFAPVDCTWLSHYWRFNCNDRNAIRRILRSWVCVLSNFEIPPGRVLLSNGPRCVPCGAPQPPATIEDVVIFRGKKALCLT